MYHSARTLNILKEAKKELIARGRVNGTLISNSGCVCALGAVGVVVAGEEGLREQQYDVFKAENGGMPAVAALADAVVDRYPGIPMDDYTTVETIYRFNDDYVQGDDQPVLDLFDKAIGYLEHALTVSE